MPAQLEKQRKSWYFSEVSIRRCFSAPAVPDVAHAGNFTENEVMPGSQDTQARDGDTDIAAGSDYGWVLGRRRKPAGDVKQGPGRCRGFKKFSSIPLFHE
jgi:hypothetical protein